MKLLISPIDEEEALEAIKGGADIIDVKNPKEGPLGASFPWTIKRIREIAPNPIEVSCTLGDMPNLPGSVSLAATGAVALGVDYVKVSLLALQSEKDAVYLMQNVVKAVKSIEKNVKVVVAGFADAKRAHSISPLLIPKIASLAECDFAMVDTAIKDEKNLLDFFNAKQLETFIDETHGYGLKVALAGSLQIEHLPLLSIMGVDIAGLRGAACTEKDRVNGRVKKQKVEELVQAAKMSERNLVASR